MKKDAVIAKIKAILSKDPRFKNTHVKVKFTDKSNKVFTNKLKT